MYKPRTLIVVPPGRVKVNAPGASIVSGELKRRGLQSEVYDMCLFDRTMDDFREKLDEGYDFVGTSAINVKPAQELSEQAKRSGAVSIVGGSLMTVLPEEFMKAAPSIDIGVISDGGPAMAEIVRGEELAEIKGIIYREGGRLELTPGRRAQHIDELVFDDDYRREAAGRAYRMGEIISTSCQFDCGFCSAREIDGKRNLTGYNLRDIKKVSSGLRYLVKHGARSIQLFMDNVGVDDGYAVSLCEELKHGPDADYLLMIRADDLLRLGGPIAELSKERRIKVALGYENGSRNVLKLLNKSLVPETIVKSENFLRKEEIPHKIFWINFGHPEMGWEDMRENVNFILDNELDIDENDYTSFLIINPGSKMWHQYRAHSEPDPENDFKIPYNFCDELERLYDRARLSFKLVRHFDELFNFYACGGSDVSDGRTYGIARDVFAAAFHSQDRDDLALLEGALMKAVDAVDEFRAVPKSPSRYRPKHEVYAVNNNVRALENSTYEELVAAVDACMKTVSC